MLHYSNKWDTSVVGLCWRYESTGWLYGWLKEKHTTTLIDANKEVGLEENAEKTKYMLLSRHQNAWQNLDIKMANRCFENVASSEIWERL
jgi:hypothetical protein